MMEKKISIALFFGLLVIFLVLTAFTPSASAQQEWSVSVRVETATEGSNLHMGFGTNASATDGYDSGLDVFPPPPVPGAKFDAYFILPEPHPIFGEKVNVDYRAPADEIEWTLHVKSTNEEIEITWDSSQVPTDLSLTMDTDGDRIPDVDMIAENSVTLNAGTYDIIIIGAARAVADSTPPTVISVSPTDEATNVPVTSAISVTFSETMNTVSVEDAFSITPEVEGTFSWVDNTMTFTPNTNSVSYTHLTLPTILLV